MTCPGAESGGAAERPRGGSGGGRVSSRRAFTLLELLLVLVISGIVAGLAVPALMRTLRGERLRAAARAVAASHRLARATAALRAEPVELRLDPRKRRVEVARRAPAPAESGEENPDAAAPPPDAAAPDDAPAGGAARDGGAVVLEALREWSADVRLVRLEIGGDTLEADAPATIPYRPGGDCPAYAVVLEDDRGDRATIRVDPIAGKAQVQYERNP